MKLPATLCLLVTGHLASAADVFVSRNGSDENDGSSEKPLKTLAGAQKAVQKLATASMSEDVTVHVEKGTYTLTEPLHLDAADSGKNGFKTRWVGSEATISGGLKITDWSEESNGVYSADLPDGTQSRNLYINDMAANYARRQLDHRADFNFTSRGMSWTDPKYDWIMDVRGVETGEVRFINSFTDRYSRIESIGDREIIMAQPSWGNQIIGYDTAADPFAEFGVFLQNCQGLLGNGGEHYLNISSNKVYYKPLDGEDMATVDARLGVQEALLSISGTYDEPAHDISIEGFTFVSHPCSRD